MSLLSMLRRRSTTLEAVEDLTPTVKLFRFRCDAPIGYEPGQIAPLVVDTGDKSYVKPYSIASVPGDPSAIEYCIKLVPEGRATPFLHAAQPGFDAKIIGPTGGLTAKGVETGNLVFIATGTGIAPFVSIVRSRVLNDTSADCSDIVLLQGASYPSDLVYEEELRNLATHHGLHYVPTISRPREAPEWRGATGRVEDLLSPERLLQLEQEQNLPRLTPDNAAILICGLQGTIANTILRSANRGFVPFDRKIRKALDFDESITSSIWWEQYDSEPVVDITDVSKVQTLRNTILSSHDTPSPTA